MMRLAPVHPGEVLMDDFIGPLGITQHRLAIAIAVPPRRINEIVHGQRRITADTALRLARYFATSDQFWINLQSHYDLEVAADAISEVLARIQPLLIARTPDGAGSVVDLARSIPWDGPPVSVDEMDEAIADAAVARFDRGSAPAN